LNGSDVGITISGKDWRKLDVPKIIRFGLIISGLISPTSKPFRQIYHLLFKMFRFGMKLKKFLPGKSITLYAPFEVVLNGPGYGTPP